MADASRILIAGGPRTGKSALASKFCKQFGGTLLRTERLLSQSFTWAELAMAAQVWLHRPGPWVMEGLTVPRVIRRWYRENDAPIPCDEIYWLGIVPNMALEDGQVPVAKAVRTVWLECVPRLLDDGVAIYNGDGEDISLSMSKQGN
jgi:hypothetical protein